VAIRLWMTILWRRFRVELFSHFTGIFAKFFCKPIDALICERSPQLRKKQALAFSLPVRNFECKRLQSDPVPKNINETNCRRFVFNTSLCLTLILPTELQRMTI
jgi:hypothetical protein